MKSFVKNIAGHGAFIFFLISAVLFLACACSRERDYEAGTALMGGDGEGDEPPESN